uniref:Ubiquitin-like protease family profile domain-containing protein n=1 Tax=Ditylenchus dipsaci TaxID=166011 RepID=A0A915CRS5_9BILA
MANTQLVHSQRIGTKTVPLTLTEDGLGVYSWTKRGRTVTLADGSEEVYLNCAGCPAVVDKKAPRKRGVLRLRYPDLTDSHSGHWSFVMVNLEKGKLVYHDSLHGDGTKHVNLIKDFVAEYAVERGYATEDRSSDFMTVDPSNWLCCCPKDIPKQQNGLDCGVFVCKFAELLLSMNWFERSANDLCSYQKKIYALDCLAGISMAGLLSDGRMLASNNTGGDVGSSSRDGSVGSKHKTDVSCYEIQKRMRNYEKALRAKGTEDASEEVVEARLPAPINAEMLFDIFYAKKQPKFSVEMKKVLLAVCSIAQLEMKKWR